MRNLSIILAVTTISHLAFASNIRVRCTNDKKPQEWVLLQLNEKREFTMISTKSWVQAARNSEFSFLSWSEDKAGFEVVRSLKARNGYSILRFITTADAIDLGVSEDLNKGFYNYQDIGSGNGNSKLTLTCKKQ